MHELPLITTVAAAFFAAWIMGLITHRLGLSPIVGYLGAGIIIGPYTPGFVGDMHVAQQLAELGVILLMFGVGLHFHLEDLNRVKWIAIPGAIGQSAVATILGMFAFDAFNLGRTAGLVIGMAMAVASTVVLIRVLQDNEKLQTRSGHVAVGWLIVEDILTIIALILLPALGLNHGSHAPWTSLGLAFLKMGSLIALTALAGTFLVPRILVHVATLRSRELFTLTVLVLSIAVAAASSLFFGASLALGAFLGGMVVGQSPVSHQAASDALPLRDAFSVLFFVSVGMIFDYTALAREPMMILTALAIVLIAKPLSAFVIVAALGHPFRTGIVVALGLAQIGEFSFILSELARKLELMPETGHSIIVATAIISISINPLLFRLCEPLERAVHNRPWLWKILNRRAERRINLENVSAAAEVSAIPKQEEPRTAVVVGYGPVGQALCGVLRKCGMRVVVVEANIGTVSRLREAADSMLTALYGDARNRHVLESAGIEKARYLLITMEMSSNPVPVIVQARQLNPNLKIFVRTRYLGDRDLILRAGGSEAIFEEAEVAIAMSKMIVREFGVTDADFEKIIDEVRNAPALDETHGEV